jgi:hypothetical protein
MKAGRPLKYKTVEELQEAIDAYFALNPERPTVTGLALHLGFHSRKSFYNYEERPEFSQPIKNALNKIRSIRPNRKLGIKYKSASQYARDKYRQDPITNLRIRINASLRYSLKNNTVTSSYLSFSIKELKNHFESLFSEGMSWDNMSEWHIDHIRPISSFNFNSVNCDDFKKCYSLDNLQPLWANDNLKKGNSYIDSNQKIAR